MLHFLEVKNILLIGTNNVYQLKKNDTNAIMENAQGEEFKHFGMDLELESIKPHDPVQFLWHVFYE